MAVVGDDFDMSAFLWSVCTKAVMSLLIASILIIAIRALAASSWYKSWFASKQLQWGTHTKGIFDSSKRELFARLAEDLKQLSGDVLELGVGQGANFEYYPQGTSLIAVDLNRHVEKHFRENLEKFGGNRVHLKRFVVASTEDMSCQGQVGVPDDSIAAVVSTRLMCSLTEEQIRKTIQEVKRVLKPGGRFYFLEHVADNPGTLRYYLQCLVSKTRVWPTLLNGCCCDRDMVQFIRQGHFKHLSFKRFSLKYRHPQMPLILRVMVFFVVSSISGYAEK